MAYKLDEEVDDTVANRKIQLQELNKQIQRAKDELAYIKSLINEAKNQA